MPESKHSDIPGIGQETNTVANRDLENQLLDNMDIERERGITIKLQSARMFGSSSPSSLFLLLFISLCLSLTYPHYLLLLRSYLSSFFLPPSPFLASASDASPLQELQPQGGGSCAEPHRHPWSRGLLL